MECIIDNNGCFIPNNKLTRKIRNIYSISVRLYNGFFKKVPCTFLINKKCQLPRYAAFQLKESKLINKIVNKINFIYPKINLNFCATLTQNQNTVMKYLIKNIYTNKNKKNGSALCVLQMDPGYGKTYVAISIINYLKIKSMIIVPNIYLLNQWKSTLEFVFPDTKIGLYYGTEKSDGDIIIAVINSAIKYPDYENIGLTVLDEAHMYCSKTFSKIFRVCQTCCVMGLSATPKDRTDKLDKMLPWYLGDIIHADKIEGWEPGNVSFSSNVIKVEYNCSLQNAITEINEKNGMVSVPKMINKFILDKSRNKLIVKYAIELYKQKKNVFIFSDRRSHLHDLYNMLIINNKNVVIEEKKASELMGGSTEQDIENAINKSKIILTTYAYSSTGVSINKMNALILATPRKNNMKQILGRIFRLKGDQNEKRIIIDIVDNKTCLKNQYYTRKKIYVNNLQSSCIKIIKHTYKEFSNQ